MVNKRIYKTISAICMAGALMLGGCGSSPEQPQENASKTGESVENSIGENSQETVVVATIDPEELFSDRDFETDYDENKSISITLTGSSARCSDGGVEIEGSTVTIRDEGTYILSGSLDDGMIIVDGDKEEKIQLVLDGVNIHSQTCAPIYILQSDKVFITLAEDSQNILSNGGSFTAIDENEIDAVIFSKEDLTINGEGALAITSPAGHGVVSKDELTVTGGSFDINCGSHGLSGKDGIGIANGSFHIVSGKDGIHAENKDDAALGYLYVQNGSFHIESQDDGVSAVGDMRIDNGHFSIAAKDDGFHGENTLTIHNGVIDITASYEGMEAWHVVVAGGDISLVAEDDGLNAAAASDEETTQTADFGGKGGNRGDKGQRPQREMPQGEQPELPQGEWSQREQPELPRKSGGHFGGNSTGSITISGGNLFINASGDGIDANGTLAITGGNVVVNGPTQGDTSIIDYDISGVIEGATFIGTGARSMAQTFGKSQQAVITVNVGDVAAKTRLSLKDQAGVELLSYVPVLDYNMVILSCPELVSGATYTLTVGTETMECTAE